MIRPRGVEAKRMMYISNGTLRLCDPVRGDLIKRSAIVPGASYPRGTNVAVYIGPASFTVELETMSPIVQLSPHMSLRHVEHWTFATARRRR